MAAQNQAPGPDSPRHTAPIIRIDQQEHDWPEEKIAPAQLRRLPPTPIPSDRDSSTPTSQPTISHRSTLS